MNITPKIDQKLVSQAKEMLLNAERIVIIPHKSPDGDAIGSGLALYNMMNNFQKDVYFISPNAHHNSLSFLPGSNKIINFEQEVEKASDLIRKAEVICFVDFNSQTRIGNPMLEVVNQSTAETLMIDHHPYPENFCHINISYPDEPASSQLMYYFIEQAGWKSHITSEIGNCLYTGIMTDTGFLSYNSSKPETYLIIAELLQIGVDKTLIHDCILNDYNKERLQLLSFAISKKMVVIEEFKTAYISLNLEELNQFDYKQGDLEGLVNIPLKMPNIQFSALFTESEQFVKISFRSKGNFPANKFSNDNFEGGGHLNAAGGKSDLNLNDTISKFIDILPRYQLLLK